MRKTTPLTLVVLAGLVGVGLTGCAAGTSLAPQSTAEACEIAQQSMSSVANDLSSSMSDVSSADFSAVVEAMDKLQGSLDEAAGKVSNAEVKSALTDLSGDVKKFGDLFAGAKDGDITSLTDKSSEIQTAASDVQTSGQKLSDLCGAK